MLCPDEELFTKTLTARDANFIAAERLDRPMRVQAKVRYKQAARWATVEQTDETHFRLAFDEFNRYGGFPAHALETDVSTKFRILQGLSQAQLGERVGLPGDRIQKYEAGTRKPKMELLKQIAAALDIETLALADPVSATPIGVMHALFEMEERFGLELTKTEMGHISIGFYGEAGSDVREYLKELWNVPKEEENIQGEYTFWKGNFPDSITRKNAEEMKKAEIKSQIEKLQRELSKLNGGSDGE